MKRSVLLVVLTICLVVVACAPPAPEKVVETVVVTKEIPVEVTKIVEKPKELKKIRVGFSWNEKMHALIKAWQDYMVAYSKEAGPARGFEVEWVFNVADSNPAQQASNIEDLIHQKVDIIGARAHDAAAIGASIKAAQEAGIPFITFDRESSTVEPIVHVGADSYVQSLTTARKFAEILKANGVTDAKCIELQGDLRDMNAVIIHLVV